MKSECEIMSKDKKLKFIKKQEKIDDDDGDYMNRMESIEICKEVVDDDDVENEYKSPPPPPPPSPINDVLVAKVEFESEIDQFANEQQPQQQVQEDQIDTTTTTITHSNLAENSVYINQLNFPYQLKPLISFAEFELYFQK